MKHSNFSVSSTQGSNTPNFCFLKKKINFSLRLGKLVWDFGGMLESSISFSFLKERVILFVGLLPCLFFPLFVMYGVLL